MSQTDADGPEPRPRIRGYLPTIAAVRRLAADWGLAIVVGLGASTVGMALLYWFAPPGLADAVAAVIALLWWLGTAALWVATGSTLISIAVWFIPGLALYAAWFLGLAPGLGWLQAAAFLGLILISFFRPAHDWWAILVSRLGTFLVRLALSREDRSIDVAAHAIRARLWVSAREIDRSGSSPYLSNLLGIRRAAQDLPTDDLSAAEVRRAVLGLVDAQYGHATGTRSDQEFSRAMETYWSAMHRFRSRSLLYRIMTLRRDVDASR